MTRKEVIALYNISKTDRLCFVSGKNNDFYIRDIKQITKPYTHIYIYI